MINMMVLYGKPSDTQHFRDYYFSTHAPLVKKFPGLRRFRVSGGPVKGPDGSPALYEFVAELEFDSTDALRTSLSSPEGRAGLDDLQNFATGGVTVLVFETREM